ncbi:MAG: hypothetical protein MSG78_01065 [Clostridiales bacterium]|nr:hypothetical protein [Clostridiales bacterium]
MTRREFLDGLEKALEGEVSAVIIAENLNYYNGYIKEEVAKGKLEEDVLDMLGDPRLIAQTIIDTNGGEGDYSTDDAGTSYEDVSYQNSWGSMQESAEEENSGTNFWFHTSKPIKWYHKVLAVLIPIILIVLIVAIAIGFLQLVAYFAVPVLIVFFCVYLFRRFMR